MRTSLKLAMLAASILVAAPAAAQAAWTRTWVMEWAEPAFLYGAKDGLVNPGTDCPAGSTAEIDWAKVLVEAGYTKEEADWLRNPANPTRSAVHGQNQMAFRGKDRANVYINPTSTPRTDHLKAVSGTVSEGLDLDGNLANGFTGVNGEKGVDHNFYKAVGCWKTYRGPQRQSSGALSQNDGMRNGSYTIVIVASGKGSDPQNDSDVTVGFYESPDKLVKDGMGNISRDYTYRIKPSRYEASFAARTVDGQIISTQAMDKVLLREPSYTRDLELLKARVSLAMNKDGTLKGVVAGYRPWEPVYRSWVQARGPVIESLTWVRLPDVYYQLKEYADYSPPEANGEKTHISFALRVEALPGYVMTPDAKVTVATVDSFKSLAKPEPARPVTSFSVVDGVVVPPGTKALSQTAEQIRPPAQRVAAAAQ